MKKNNTITALKIGIKINNKIYYPLIKTKKNLLLNSFDNALRWFNVFVDETIQRLDIVDFDYFKFQTWSNRQYNQIYKDLRDIIGTYYEITGDTIFFALKRVFENIRDYKV